MGSGWTLENEVSVSIRGATGKNRVLGTNIAIAHLNISSTWHLTRERELKQREGKALLI